MASTQPVIGEIQVKGALTLSRIPGIDYSLNPYLGCAYGCSYCYADFMRKYSGHAEPWGGFVDAKVNIAERLERELRRKKPGHVSLSLVTDPYQPVERHYGLTRRCLELLRDAPAFTVSILTRSPLVLRDLELFRSMPAVEVGLSIPTDDDRIRAVPEPRGPAIALRVAALRKLREAGICTYAFLGPLLPMNPERLAGMLAGAVDYVYIDKMNYPWKIRPLYRAHGWDEYLEPAYFRRVAGILSERLAETGAEIHCVIREEDNPAHE
jgi:DNA repair photolyase